MTQYTLRVWPDKALLKAPEPFSGSVEELKQLTDLMFEWMGMASGQGLAANQLGADVQVFIMEPPSTGQRYVFVNPKFEECEQVPGQVLKGREGCLSLPGPVVHTKRNWKVALAYLDETLTPRRQEFTGESAGIVQHEMEHLAGKCILSDATPLVRELALKRVKNFIKKVARDNAEDRAREQRMRRDALRSTTTQQPSE